MQTSWVDLLHWTLSCLLLSLESGVDCPCPWFHANSLLLAFLLSSRNFLCWVASSTHACCPAPTASQLLSPANSDSRPRTTSGYGEISGPRILCLVSRQNRQRNRLLWRETHIGLHSNVIVSTQLKGFNYCYLIPLLCSYSVYSKANSNK